MTPARQVALTLALVTAIKVVLAAQLELTSLEAYYWLYGRHPALGYFDHPGMVGWMTWLSTALFGHSTLGVRMIPVLGGTLGAWLAFLGARRLYGDGAGRMAALLVALMPMTFIHSTEATPDAPLLLFWSATLWALANALSGKSAAWWYAAGAFLGAAMLSKYSGVLLAVGTLGFVVFSPDHRAWLKRREPYAAVLIALAVFSPTLIWNAQHGWRSITYQGLSRFDEPTFRLKYLYEFPGTQLALVTPIVCLWAWGAGIVTVAKWRTAAWQDRLAASLGLPLLVLIYGLAVTRSVRGHWTAPAYAAAFVLAAGVVERGGAWGRRLHAATLAVAGVALVIAPIVFALLPREQRAPWAALAGEVRARRADFVIAADYHDAAQMAWHLRPIEGADWTAVGAGNKAFPDWWEPSRHRGQRAVILWRSGDTVELDLIRARFERVGWPETVTVTRFPGKKENYVLVVAEGYR